MLQADKKRGSFQVDRSPLYQILSSKYLQITALGEDFQRLLWNLKSNIIFGLFFKPMFEETFPVSWREMKYKKCFVKPFYISLMFHSCTPWKHQKTKDFRAFSRSIEIEHWA